MGHGYGVPFHKKATLANFDGSATAKTLWLPGSALVGLTVDVGMTTDTSTPAGRWFGAFLLEVFSGATWNGSAWTGGAWVEILALQVELVLNTTALAIATKASFRDFMPPSPMRFPDPYQGQIQDPTVAGGGISYITPNTHTGTPVATETDVRLYVKSVLTAPTGMQFSATALIAE